MTTTLSKTETSLLLAAAERNGTLAFPDGTKPATQQRHLGRFLRDGLIVAADEGHALTPAGYCAVGLRPPRRKRVEAAVIPGDSAQPAVPRGTKQALVKELLGRDDGATIAELIAATGWLPHTTRAALSRLRSAGTTLLKSAREDGATAYRIVVDEPAAPKRRLRTRQAEAVEAAASA